MLIGAGTVEFRDTKVNMLGTDTANNPVIDPNIYGLDAAATDPAVGLTRGMDGNIRQAD